MMPAPIQVEIVSQEQLTHAVGYFCSYLALNCVAVFEDDTPGSARDPFRVNLRLGDQQIDARVVAIIGTGVLLSSSESNASDEYEDELRIKYFAVRREGDGDFNVPDVWCPSATVIEGTGTADEYDKAAIAAAQYIFA